MQQDLGVGLASENVALCLETAAQFAIVVNLAVEGDDQLAVGADHRLGAGVGEIDDREPPVPEADAAIGDDPLRPDHPGHAPPYGRACGRSSARSIGLAA